MRERFLWIRLRISTAAAFLSLVGGSITASGQTAAQLTSPTYQPSIENHSGGDFKIPEVEGSRAPQGADGLFVSLAKVRIDGDLGKVDSIKRGLIDNLTRERVSCAYIFAAAHALEVAYINAGYVLVRVIVPPQPILDGGTLKLIVVNGFIEGIEARQVPDLVHDRILALLMPLVDRPGLTRTEIERRVLLASDTPGVALQSTLAPGKSSGSSILIIEVTHQPLNGSVNFDNSLSSSLGASTLSIGLEANSIGSKGELIYTQLSFHPNFGTNGFLDTQPRNRGLALGFVLPLGNDGLSLNLEGVETRTVPTHNSTFFTNDVFQRVFIRLRYPWVRSRDFDFQVIPS